MLTESAGAVNIEVENLFKARKLKSWGCSRHVPGIYYQGENRHLNANSTLLSSAFQKRIGIPPAILVQTI